MIITDLAPMHTTACSKIYLGRYRDQDVVLKMTRCHTPENDLLRKLQQSPVVPVLSTYRLGHRQICVMPKAHTDLFELLAVHGPLLHTNALYMLKNVATALRDLHAMGYSHRDISAENVLLFPDGFRLCDFGLSSKYNQKPNFAGKVFYAAPEFFNASLMQPGYDLRWSDAYSLGVTFFTALTGYLPWKSGAIFRDRGRWRKAAEKMNSFPEGIRDILLGLLCPIPEFRLNMLQVLIKIEQTLKKLKKD